MKLTEHEVNSPVSNRNSIEPLGAKVLLLNPVSNHLCKLLKFHLLKYDASKTQCLVHRCAPALHHCVALAHPQPTLASFKEGEPLALS